MKRFHHGTNMVINSIDLGKGRVRTDFGKGFYLGSNLASEGNTERISVEFSHTAVIDLYRSDINGIPTTNKE